MKLNLLTVMMNINGEPLLEPDKNSEVQKVTLRTVFVNALMIPVEKDTGVDKVAKYSLAIDIQKNDEVVLSAEQIVLLKEAIAKPYGPVIVGQVYAILDGKEEA